MDRRWRVGRIAYVLLMLFGIEIYRFIVAVLGTFGDMNPVRHFAALLLTFAVLFLTKLWITRHKLRDLL